MVVKKEITSTPSTSQVSVNPIKKNKTPILIGLAVVIVLVFAFMFLTSSEVKGVLFSGYAQSADLPIYVLENVFVDIDSDGDPDYLKYGEVIINPSIGGTPTEGNFQKGQP